MDTRFGLSVLGALLLAAFVGLLMAQTQPKTAAAPVPTAMATAIPTPLPGMVEIVADPHHPGQAVYAPSTLFVAKGGTVTWVNDDTVSHTVAADNGSFTSPVLAPGQTYSRTFKKVGAISYSDYLTPNMVGEITVYK